MTPELDCGDNGGMRTNGGCRCFANAGFSRGMHASAREMLLVVLRLRACVTSLRMQAEEAIARWLESEGWKFDEVCCQYWQHPKFGQTDGLWEAAQRQREG